MRQGLVLLAALVSFSAAAQIHTTRTRSGAEIAPTPGYHRSPGATPKECLQPHLDPWLGALCATITRGRPQASNEVLTLPAHGTSAAKQSGVACMGGLAMRRLPNGWEQIRDSNANYLRCVEG
jgi:hypothetical protein